MMTNLKMIKLKCVLKKTNTLVKGIFLSLCILISSHTYSQRLELSHFDNYEVAEVSVDLHNVDIELIALLEGVEIDHGSTKHKANLYITKLGFLNLEKHNIPLSWSEPHKSNIKMKSLEEYNNEILKSNCLPPMDFYPSYEAYIQMMYDFEEKYPDLCEIIDIGTLSSGRKILVAHIGDQLGAIEEEPNFLYTSTMHGDELAGFPMMLMYIDMLLCNYGTDEKITEAVNNINIYINPLANPDGTYRGGNQTVEQAIRFNNQFVDINRNFPDPREGPNPDGRNHQEETLIFMDFATQYDIHLSCNIHGGKEVCSYPWDTYIEKHADDEWWIDVTRAYADTAHTHAPTGYLTFLNDGITNGYEWYELTGGRQDYMTYFHRGREFSLEISNQKILDSDLIPTYWDYNKSALLNYMCEAQYGLRGKILDCRTGLPLLAEISIPGHDMQNSSVFSSEADGSYFRFLAEGQYDIMVTAEDYDTLFANISIVDKSTVRYDGELCPLGEVATVDNNVLDLFIYSNKNKIYIQGDNNILNATLSLYALNGTLIQKSSIVDMSTGINQSLPSGIYIATIEVDGILDTYKVLISQ